MPESLDVIALISGGKDSFFSILHCIQNGHKVVALANLYPAPPPPKPNAEDDEHDLNSFMYQTVGHTVIPLYEEALGIPLFRQPILGTAIQTGTSYGHSDEAVTVDLPLDLKAEALSIEQDQDETESLVPLLRRIMVEHPTANALSTGAILSTYQRTRIESVAIRLGLTPLAYLWKYPVLPPGMQASLLQDMQAIGLDARIVKVASGGLDESFLWQNVANEAVIRRMEKSMNRFGTQMDGAVLGEGGEFETLVVDGPSDLFKGRVEIQEKGRRFVREGGGSAWLRILDAKVVAKPTETTARTACRTPDLLEHRFKNLLKVLEEKAEDTPPRRLSSIVSTSESIVKSANLSSVAECQDEIIYWSFSNAKTKPQTTISDEALHIITEIKRRLVENSLKPSNIISTLIILRSMADFAAINKVYGSLFTQPNPPARVTISCGSTMSKNTNIAIHLKIHNKFPTPSPRKALHVQSRSYWAPANIGPYSQAISLPTSTTSDPEAAVWTVDVAGQIPLIPSSMTLPSPQISSEPSESHHIDRKHFKLQTALSLQHLWRIGREMTVSWWTSAVVYLPRDTPERTKDRARIAAQAWSLIHAHDLEEDEDEDEERDLWEEKYHAGMEIRSEKKAENELPDWGIVRLGEAPVEMNAPPLWAVEVEELPRESGIEWHAHLGVIAGPVKLNTWGEEDSWVVSQCAFGSRMQVVVMISYSENSSELSGWLRDAFDSLGGEVAARKKIYISYLAASMEVIDQADTFAGMIPCRSIWDGSGCRLSAVLLIDSSL